VTPVEVALAAGQCGLHVDGVEAELADPALALEQLGGQLAAV
jgi:hypothetical protein